MKRTIEINDTLEERVESAIDSVKQELLDFLEANPDQDKLPYLNNNLDLLNAIYEIIDGSVPIYTHELEDNYYLHGSELDRALDDAGLYNDNDLGRLDRDQYIMGAFYCYIQERVNEWYSDKAQAIFDEWLAKRTCQAVVNLETDTITVFKGESKVFECGLQDFIDEEIMSDKDDLEGLKIELQHRGILNRDARLEED